MNNSKKYTTFRTEQNRLILQSMPVTVPIINKVDQSGIITINLEDYYPKGERVVYDIKNNLIQGMVLKEQDFREFVKNHDWSEYQNKYVALTCPVDAIVPSWAYMLLTVSLEPYAKWVTRGGIDVLEASIMQHALSKINISDFKDKRVVIKGCGEVPVPDAAYVEITRLLRPVVKSFMYGEPCSTVPLYKKK